MLLSHRLLTSSILPLVTTLFQTFAAPPPEAPTLQEFDARAQPTQSYHQNETVRQCMAERKRWLYDARSNTLTMTVVAMESNQEIPMGLKIL